MLPIEFKIGDFESAFNPAVVKGQDGLVLVDCGNPGDCDKLEQVLVENGLKLSDVKKIIMTHHDSDHMGALKAVLDRNPDIEVLCSAEQAPYITGLIKPLRVQLAEKRLPLATDENEKKELQGLIRQLSGVETIDKVTIIDDGHKLPEFGIEIIMTSGHMPGHLCVYVSDEKTLITGDALVAIDGKLSAPDARFTLDMDTAIKSAKKLLNFEIDSVICYHGGLVTKSVRESLEEIVKG